MRGKLNWLLLSPLLAVFLQGCAGQPVAVVAPCAQIPPLPEHLTLDEFTPALKKLNDYLTTHGEPALPTPSN